MTLHQDRQAARMEVREPNRLFMSEDEYLRFDIENDFKSEYASGEVIVMAGASYRHNLISNNLGTEFNIQLREKDCVVLQESQRIQIHKQTKNKYRYPDLVVACLPVNFVKGTKPDTLINPIVLIEILSSSPASVDTVQKVIEYRQISTLQDYLIIAQDSPYVMHHQRPSTLDEKWGYEDYTSLNDMIELPAIACTLKLSDIYRRIDFDDDETDT